MMNNITQSSAITWQQWERPRPFHVSFFASHRHASYPTATVSNGKADGRHMSVQAPNRPRNDSNQ